MKLPDALAAAGHRLLHLPHVGSTMDVAREAAANLAAPALWIVADKQESGRGRLGRDWNSPVGNLHLTLLIPSPCERRDQPKVGFVAGVALCQAVRSFISEPAMASLKWPNDLLLSGKKVSGLLLEGLQNGGSIAIGIGVNIVASPSNTPYPTAALAECLPDFSAEQLFPVLALALDEELNRFADGSGFPLVRQRWLACSAHLGQSISVRLNAQKRVGIFRDIDRDGRLLLETSEGLERIDAGDVFPLDK